MAMKDTQVPWQEAQWWLLAGTALAAFVGWRSKEAVEAVKARRTEDDIKEMRDRLSALENEFRGQVRRLDRDASSRDTSLRVNDQQFQQIHDALGRIEKRIDGKSDKP